MLKCSTEILKRKSFDVSLDPFFCDLASVIRLHFNLGRNCRTIIKTYFLLSLFITVCGCYGLESLSLVVLCLLFKRIFVSYLHRVHNPVWVTNRSGAACRVVRFRLAW